MTELTVEHQTLLYMISLYSRTPGRRNPNGDKWVGKMPLLVLLYEAVVNKVLDYDFAPSSELVGARRVFLNISQEGRDDIDDLIEHGLVACLKLSSSDYQSVTAYQVTEQGRAKALEVPEDVQALVRGLVLDEASGRLVTVEWRNSESQFYLVWPDGREKVSDITDCEDVSYVSSPYLPHMLLHETKGLSSNAHLASASATGTHNIRDDLDEVITLDCCRLLVGEYIPFGSNHIVHLNEKLGTSERVQGGFFTSTVTHSPTQTQFDVQPGLTSVNIVNFDRTAFLTFEAEVHFPEDDGIIQLEKFGVHVEFMGAVIYGLQVESIMDRVRVVSLDHLARVQADVLQDSSTIMDNLVSAYQRSLLGMIYQKRAQERDKFCIIMCDAIEPRLPADKYLDKEENENELKQVLGDTNAAYDLSDGTLVIMGRKGCLLAGPSLRTHEATITYHLYLMALDLFMNNYFLRIFVLEETLRGIAAQIDRHESDPASMSLIRKGLADAAKDVIFIEEVHAFIDESLEELRDVLELGIELDPEFSSLLGMSTMYNAIMRRVKDVKKKMGSSRHELQGLREMTDVLGEAQMYRMSENMANNTGSLEALFRSNERASSSLELMQVILSGTLAFELLDRLQMGDKWAAIAEPLLDTPGVWFFLNISLWAMFALGLIKLMAFLTDRSAGVLAVRIGLDLPIKLPQFKEWLKNKPVSEEDLESDRKILIKKVSWTEDPHPKWKGSPPKIEIVFDFKYGFLLKAYFESNKASSTLTEEDLKALFLRDLLDAGITDFTRNCTPDGNVDHSVRCLLPYMTDAEKAEVKRICKITVSQKNGYGRKLSDDDDDNEKEEKEDRKDKEEEEID